MTQTCGVCGRDIEPGGFGGAPMIQHYKHNHPAAYYGPPDGYEATTLADWTGDK